MTPTKGKRGEAVPTIAIDTREQTPWTFRGSVCRSLSLEPPTERATLETGDYAIVGFEALARIERKTLPDFIASVTRERERFWRELERLVAFPVRAVVVEGAVEHVEAMVSRSQARPQSVLASAFAITADFGIPVLWMGTRSTAEWTAAWMLRRAYQRHLISLEVPAEVTR